MTASRKDINVAVKVNVNIMVHTLLGDVFICDIVVKFSLILSASFLKKVNCLNSTLWTDFGTKLILYHHNQFLWNVRYP